MTAALTIRVELAFDPAMHSLVRDFMHVLTRLLPEPKAPAADLEPVKDSAPLQVRPEVSASSPASAQNWFRTTPSERAALLLRVERGMKPKHLAAELGVELKRLHDALYRARQERKLVAGAEAEAGKLQPQPEPAPPPPPIQAATTVRTLDQHRAVAATPSASLPATQASAAVVSGNLPPIPRLSGAPQRPGRAALEAEMKAFEAANGVTRLPTITQMAEVGVPTAFLDIAAATKWLTANGHSVRPAGRMRFQINGKPVAATDFVANAQMIAREHAMKLLKERRAG
jgi:hypothetical protein